MPIYEYRCQDCDNTDSFFLRSYGSPAPSNCRHCGSEGLNRIISAFTYVKSEATKRAELDPKYHKMVDQALAKAPRDTDPDYHMRKMVPFSKAKSAGEPYFKE